MVYSFSSYVLTILLKTENETLLTKELADSSFSVRLIWVSVIVLSCILNYEFWFDYEIQIWGD